MTGQIFHFHGPPDRGYGIKEIASYFNYFFIPISFTAEKLVKKCNNWYIPLSMQSAIGSAGDIFIIPHRDLLLPTDPVGIRVKCPDCGENILSCDSREHSATHLR